MTRCSEQVMQVDGIDKLDELGRVLLARLAAAPEDLDCARRFDSLYYEIVWKYLRTRHEVLGARVARYLGVAGTVAPQVLAEEVDEVAHDATATALRRVRQNAAKFDPSKGSPTRWVIGSAEYAYIEVAKGIVNARRSARLSFVDPDDLLEIEDPGQSTEEHVLRQLGDADALADAASCLSEMEFAALRVRHTLGYSRSEAATVLFGDETMKKQVDGLVERGARKLAAAWEDRRLPRLKVESIKFPDPTDDYGGIDE